MQIHSPTIAALALMACSLGNTAVAADSTAHGDADDPPRAHDAAPRTKKAGARGPAPVDPMQDLRDKLAAKLGATKASDGKGEQMLRVATQPDGEIQLTPKQAAPGARPARPAWA